MAGHGRLTPSLRWAAAITAASWLAACCGAEAASCLKADDPAAALDGRLVRKAIGGETVFLLQLMVDECLAGSDAKDNVRGARSLHVYATRPALQAALVRNVGRDVYLTGRAFGAVTPQHKAPIVMEVSAVERLP